MLEIKGTIKIDTNTNSIWKIDNNTPNIKIK